LVIQSKRGFGLRGWERVEGSGTRARTAALGRMQPIPLPTILECSLGTLSVAEIMAAGRGASRACGPDLAKGFVCVWTHFLGPTSQVRLVLSISPR